MTNNVGDFVVSAVLFFPHGVEDPALYRFKTVLNVRDRPFENYIRGIFQEPVAIHPAHMHGIIVALVTGLQIRRRCKRLRLSSGGILFLIILLRNVRFLRSFFVVGNVFWRF
jgi:hypothetical protein